MQDLIKSIPDNLINSRGRDRRSSLYPLNVQLRSQILVYPYMIWKGNLEG